MALKVGDRVQVNKEDQARNWIASAEVIQVPQGQGDVWGFRDLITGRDIYTNETFTAYVEPQA